MPVQIDRKQQNPTGAGQLQDRHLTVKDVLKGLESLPELGAADVALLLYLVADDAAEKGQLDPAATDGILELFLSKKIDESALALFRKEWFVPFGKNGDGTALIAAYEKLGGNGADLDLGKMQKLFVVAASQRELTVEEHRALSQIRSQATMTKEERGQFAALLLNNLIESLSNLRSSATLDGSTVDIIEDAVKQDTASTDTLLDVAEDVFLRAKSTPDVQKRFWKILSQRNDWDPLELTLLKKTIGSERGKINASTLSKLLILLGANRNVSQDERQLLEGLKQGALTPEAGQLLEAWLKDTSKAPSAPPLRRDPTQVPTSRVVFEGSYCFAASPNEKCAAFASDTDSGVILWDPDKNKFKPPLLGHSGQVLGVAFSPNSKQLVSLDENRKLIRWDVEKGKKVDEFTFPAEQEGDEFFIDEIALLPPDGRVLSVLDSWGRVFLWPLKKGGKPVLLGGDDAPLAVSMACGPDGRVLATWDGTSIVLWDTKTGKQKLSQEGLEVQSLCFGPDGKTIICADTDGHVRFRDVATLTCTRDCPLRPEFFPVDIALSSDGRRLLLDGGQGEVHVLDPSTMKPVHPPVMNATDGLCKLACLSDGFLSRYDGDIRRWEPSVWDPYATKDDPDNTGNEIGQPLDRSAIASQKTRLVERSLSALEASPKLSAMEGKLLVNMLADLAQEKALTPQITDRVNELTTRVTLDVGAAEALSTDWFASGLCGLDPAALEVLKHKAAGDPPYGPIEILRLVAVSGGSLNAIGMLLESVSADKLMPHAASTFGLALVHGLSQQVERAIERPRFEEQMAKTMATLAVALKERFPENARSVDKAMTSLLFLASHKGESASYLRPAFADGVSLSSRTLRLALTRFVSTEGFVSLAELRAIATAIDADGKRSQDDQWLLERLRRVPVTGGAEGQRDVLVDGITKTEDLAGEDCAPNGKTDGTGDFVVWEKENEVASGGNTVRIGMSGDVEVDQEGLKLPHIHVSGMTTMTKATDQAPFGAQGTGPATNDGFDQVQALWAADHVLQLLSGMGVELDNLTKATKNNGVLRICANATNDVNAWYSPGENMLSFGTCNDRFHTASDSDVVIHEIGHYILDKLNPNMFSMEGSAIHEGFGDALAALSANNSKLSEGFGRILDEGELRDVDNELKLSQVSTECHDRGKVYGGFIWAMKKHLAEALGDDLLAVDLMLGVLVKHGFFYKSSRANLDPASFVEAMIEAAKSYLADRGEPSLVSDMCNAMVGEAEKRELVEPGWKPKASANNVTVAGFNRTAVSATGGVSDAAPEDLIKRLTETLGLANRSDVVITLVTKQQFGDTSKYVFRANALDPTTNALLPVEDGYIAVVEEEGKAVDLGGSGLELPSSFDVKPINADLPAILASVKNQLPALVAAQIRNVATRNHILAHADELLDPAKIRTDEIVFGGRRQLRISTPAAQFLVDPRTMETHITRVAYVR